LLVQEGAYELIFAPRMKAVLALAMGAAALAPSQPKVRNEARDA